MEKKKKKTIFKNIIKKTSILMLSALLIFTSVFSSYGFESKASTFEQEVEDLLNSIGSSAGPALIDLVRSGSYIAGAKLGEAGGALLGVPPTVGSVAGAWAFGSLANGVMDWYENNNTETERIHGGGGRSFQAVKRSGVSTSQNTTNYNTTKNMSIYNENKTWNSTTNNYDYTYNWYNPITNTYNTTNEYTYNATYNTYNYVTYDIDYTTNYYIQDNRTYISYYIVNENNETGEEEETYVEMYYELPDGRNSLYLTVDDIKGQYFPSNYSKYISVAEDDGTTLGLWHLDGDLKDSSYHGNTAGSAYNNVYTDGLYTGGKQFSDSEDDFLELKLDKVDLPNTWTLEWCEYIPDSSATETIDIKSFPYSSSYPTEHTSKKDYYVGDVRYDEFYYDDSKFDLVYDVKFKNYLSIDGSEYLFEPSTGYFVPYAMTYDGHDYAFYINGVLADSYNLGQFKRSYKNGKYSSTGKKTELIDLSEFNITNCGLLISDDCIKFYTKESLVDTIAPDNYYLGWHSENKSTGEQYFLHYSHAIFNLYISSHKNSIIDEVRLSNGVLYTGDSYTPSSQAFTTNTVLAVPENPSKHEIAFKTNTDISEVRFGGARPTYPTNGYVFVSLDADDKVESIQQYQEDGWYEIEASLYTGTDWVSFKEVNMEYLGIDGVGDTDESGGDSGDDTGGDSGDTGGDSSGGGVSAILEGIGKFFDTLLTLVGKIIGMLSDFVNSVLTLFESFTVFTDGFSGFLTGAFGFIPQEAINVIVTGITLLVILAIIKFLK